MTGRRYLVVLLLALPTVPLPAGAETPLIAASLEEDAEARLIAVSVAGNATTGDGCVLFSCGQGIAVSGGGNASSHHFVSVSLARDAQGGLAWSGRGNASGYVLAGSLFGDASCMMMDGGCYAVSGTGNATARGLCPAWHPLCLGGVAVSGTGHARGTIGLSLCNLEPAACMAGSRLLP